MGLSKFVIWWQQGGLFANLFSSFQQSITHCFHLFLGNPGRNGRGWNFDYYFKTGMRLHTPPRPGFGTGMRFVLNKRDGVGMRATRPVAIPIIASLFHFIQWKTISYFNSFEIQVSIISTQQVPPKSPKIISSIICFQN